MYLILDGVALLQYKPYDSGLITLTHLREGDAFGWSAVIGGVGLYISKQEKDPRYPDAEQYIEVISPIEDTPGWKAGFMPGDLIDDYLALRDELDVGLGGLENTVWEGTHDQIKAIGCYEPLADKIVELLGEDLALNFTLTQFTSTQRDWHQDDYLGPPDLYGRYCVACAGPASPPSIGRCGGSSRPRQPSPVWRPGPRHRCGSSGGRTASH